MKKNALIFIIVLITYCRGYYQLAFGMEDLNQGIRNYSDTLSILETSPSMGIDVPVTIEKDTTIISDDGKLWKDLNAETASPDYTWGSAAVFIDGSTMVVKDGTITDKDISLWSVIPSRVAKTIQKLIFQDVVYKGSMYKMFDSPYTRTIESIDLSGLDTTEVTSMERVFTSNCVALNKVTFGEPEDNILETSSIESTSEMFYRCANLKTINLDGVDLTNNTNMSKMFDECVSLEELSWKNLNTSNVRNMTYLFSGCTSLKSIDLSRFDTQNVLNMALMFYYCGVSSVSMDDWDTSKVTSMEGMFFGTGNLKYVSMNNWSHQPALKKTSLMFHQAGIEELHMQNFDTKNVTDMSAMFSYCMFLTKLDVSFFDTANVLNFERIFEWMINLSELNISGWDTRNAGSMNNMLVSTFNLQKITLGPTSLINSTTQLGYGNDTTGLPNSWVSVKNFTTYESTNRFLTDYKHQEEGEDTFVRGYPYTIEYYDRLTDNLLYEQKKITYEDFSLIDTDYSRRYISSWQLNKEGEELLSKNSYNNLGITVSNEVSESVLGQITKLYSASIKDIEAESNVNWESNKEFEYINQDKSISSWSADFILEPVISLDGSIINEEDIYYKIEIVDSDEGTKLSEDIIIKTKANESNKINLTLNTTDLKDAENVSLNFYQLSFSETNIAEKVPVTVEPNAQLNIKVSIFDSFKITEYPSLLKWEFLQSNSIGVLERTPDNQTRLEVLNSRFEEHDWKVKLKVNTTEDLPFDFMWRSTNGDSFLLDIGEPVAIMNSKSAQTEDGYNYSDQWDSTQGLLIKSDKLLNPTNYGQNIQVVWTLEQGPDFS